jgi:rhomboid protease GluP
VLESCLQTKMKNLFTSTMAPKSSNELERIIEFSEQYTDEAVLACLWELKKREELSAVHLELLEKLETSIEKEEIRRIEKEERKKREAKEDAKLFFNFCTFKTLYKIVPGIIYLNILIYVLMLMSGVHPLAASPYDLLLWGGNLTELSLGDQPWRLISHMFLHGNIAHIVMNMVALAYIGIFLEAVIGSKLFIVSYFITGVVGGLISAYWNVNIVSVGASGSIFGLLGISLSLLLISKEKGLIQALLPNILIIISCTIVFGLFGFGHIPGRNNSAFIIDNASHIGGLLTGILLGVVLGLSVFRKLSPLEKVTKHLTISAKDELED